MSQDKALPVLIVKPNTMSKADIELMRKDGFILVVECAEPEACRFLETPAPNDVSTQARAALQLIRSVTNRDGNPMWDKNTIGNWWANILLNYSQPKPVDKVKK